MKSIYLNIVNFIEEFRIFNKKKLQLIRYFLFFIFSTWYCFSLPEKIFNDKTSTVLFDGNKWEEIAIISGSGTSIGVIDYEYNDFTHFTNGLVYYQINQVDFNGKKYAFEKIISESVCSESEDPIIFPNPTKGSINIKTIKEGELKLYDVTGRIVLNEILLPTVNTFELSNFSKGIYTSHIKLGLKEYIQKILID